MDKPLLFRDLNRLAGEANVAPNTVRRWLDGKPIQPSSRARLEVAAATLGLASPAAPPSTPQAA